MAKGSIIPTYKRRRAKSWSQRILGWIVKLVLIFLVGSVFSVLGRTPEGGSSLAGVGLFIVWILAVSVGLWRTPARGGV